MERELGEGEEMEREENWRVVRGEGLEIGRSGMKKLIVGKKEI